jgi:hypothetical protein
MNAILAEGAGIAVNPTMIETIEAVEKATAALPIGEGASAQDIGKILKLDKSAAWRRLTKARDEGFVVNLEVRKGMQGKYRATQQEVELLNILPSAEELREKHHSRQSPRNRCNRATGRQKPLRIMKMTVARTVATRLQAVASTTRVATRLQAALQPLSR